MASEDLLTDTSIDDEIRIVLLVNFEISSHIKGYHVYQRKVLFLEDCPVNGYVLASL